MPKYKIKYWQGGNIESTIIEASCKENACNTFYFMADFTDIISCDECKTEDDYCKEIATLTASNEELTVKNESLTADNETLQGENTELKAENTELSARVDELEAAGSAEELESLIDESGVLDSTDGTATEKVETLIDLAEWEKVWYKHTETMTSVTSLFAKFQGKTIPRTNLISLTSMQSFLSEAPNIEYIDYYLNTEKATNFTYCFRHCAALKWIVGVNTSSATNVGGIFFGCSSLETIQQPLDFSKVTYIGNGLQAVKALKDIRFVPESIKISITFESKNLSDESIESIIHGLAPVETTQSLICHSAVVDKLSGDEWIDLLIEMTDKNWLIG